MLGDRSVKNITELQIGLASLPPELGQLAGLQKLLILHCGALASLPAELWQLAALQKLSIEGCPALASLPAELGQLAGLQKLRISQTAGPWPRCPRSLGSSRACRSSVIFFTYDLSTYLVKWYICLFARFSCLTPYVALD